MNKNHVATLAQSGLSAQEATLYASLLGASSLSISGIVKRSGLHRPAVYAALPALIAKGIVSTTLSGKRKLYIAESPRLLAKEFDERAEAFRATLDELAADYANKEDRPTVKLLEGKKGLRSVLDDLAATLKSGDTFFRTSSRNLGTDVERYVPKGYRQARDKKKLEQLVITNSALKENPHKKRIECYSKVMPAKEDPFTYDIASLIYGDKVAFVDYASETALVIENARFARFQERLFKSLFQRL